MSLAAAEAAAAAAAAAELELVCPAELGPRGTELSPEMRPPARGYLSFFIKVLVFLRGLQNY